MCVCVCRKCPGASFIKLITGGIRRTKRKSCEEGERRIVSGCGTEILMDHAVKHEASFDEDGVVQDQDQVQVQDQDQGQKGRGGQ